MEMVARGITHTLRAGGIYHLAFFGQKLIFCARPAPRPNRAQEFRRYKCLKEYELRKCLRAVSHTPSWLARKIGPSLPYRKQWAT